MTADLQKRLGYHFKDDTLLKRALTHASAGMERDYERLEFLGDRVVGIIVAAELFKLYPDDNEGDLARRHTALVRGETLARAAKTLNLGDDIILSNSEKQSGGAENDNILCDVMEAVMGAVFLDGGLDGASKVLNTLIAEDLKTMQEPPMDSKTALQEWSQARGLGLPEYDIVTRSGPDHAPEFVISVTIPSHGTAQAPGTSKRAAEKAAAQKLLDQLS